MILGKAKLPKKTASARLEEQDARTAKERLEYEALALRFGFAPVAKAPTRLERNAKIRQNFPNLKRVKPVGLNISGGAQGALAGAQAGGGGYGSIAGGALGLIGGLFSKKGGEGGGGGAGNIQSTNVNTSASVNSSPVIAIGSDLGGGLGQGQVVTAANYLPWIIGGTVVLGSVLIIAGAIKERRK